MKQFLNQNGLRLFAVLAALALVAFGVFPDPAMAGVGAVALMVGETVTIEQLGQAFAEFRKANDDRFKEIEAKGRADPLLSGKVDKANEAIEKFLARMEAYDAEQKAVKARADALEATLKRVSKGSAGDAKVEAKYLAEYAAMYGGNQDIATDELYLQHKAALVRFMRKGDDSKLHEFQAKAMSVDSQADGGYWVMPDTTGRVVAKVFESSPLRSYAAVQGISTDALEGDYDLDEAGSGWVGERSDRTETTTPQVGQWRIPVHEMYAEPRATQKLLDDSMVDPEAWLSGKVSAKFGRDEATAFVTGDGNGKPRGFLTYANGVPTKGAWKVIEQVKTGVNGAFAAAPAGGDIFLDVEGKMKDEYKSGLIWAMNRLTRAAARKLKDSNGDYVLQMDFSAGVKSTIIGIPVVAFSDMPDYTTTGALGIALANFGTAYQIVDRIGIRVLRDPFTAKPYVKFYTTRRVGGDVINHEAIKLAQFSA